MTTGTTLHSTRSCRGGQPDRRPVVRLGVQCEDDVPGSLHELVTPLPSPFRRLKTSQ